MKIKLVLAKTKRGFCDLLVNEKRSKWFTPIFAILLSLVASCILIVASGVNPFLAIFRLFQGAGIFPKGGYGFTEQAKLFMNMVNYLAPMIFASLAVCVALKSGLFNIGVSGQMLFSGFIASLLGYVAFPSGLAWLHKLLVIILGMSAGAFYAGIIGLLKYKFNINEVVSSIMLNYIAMYFVSYFVYNFYLDPVMRVSIPIQKSASLTLFATTAGGTSIAIPLAIVLAIAAVFFVKFLLDKTKLGFEIKAVGHNKVGSRYAGINVGRNILFAMLISGALAGLAGTSHYLGTTDRLPNQTLLTMGYDAIAVCLLGSSSPVGIVFSALLISSMTKGADLLKVTMGVSNELIQIIIALMLLFATCSEFMKYLARKSLDKQARKEEDSKKEQEMEVV